MNKALLVIFFITTAFAVRAQPGIEQDFSFRNSWQDAISAPTCLVQTPDGGYITGGNSGANAGLDKSAASIGGNDFWIIKFGVDGKKQWDKTIGGTDYESLASILVTSDGGYLLGGSSGSNAGGDKSENDRGADRNTNKGDYWIVKLDANGLKQWDKTFGGSSPDGLTSMLQTADGGFLIGGNSASSRSGDKSLRSKGGSDFWMVKVAADGTKQWDKTIGSPYDDYLSTILTTADGGFLLSGTSGPGVGADRTAAVRGSNDYWIVKIAADGTRQWDNAYGGSGNDKLAAVLPTPDGGYLLGGSSTSNASGEKSENCFSTKGLADFWIMKVTANGTMQWENTIGSKSNEELKKLLNAPDGGYVLAGISNSDPGGDMQSPVHGDYDIWLVKTSANGIKLWDKAIGSSKYDNLGSITPTHEGGFMIGAGAGTAFDGDNTAEIKGAWWLVKFLPETSVKKLSFADANIHFESVQGAQPPLPQTSGLKASTGTPVIKVADINPKGWLAVNNLAKPGTLKLELLSGFPFEYAFRTKIIATAPGYERAVMNVTIKSWKLTNNTSMRINAGGKAFTAADGRLFTEDRYYGGVLRSASAATGNILNTEDDDLYRSGRCTPSFNYSIPVQNGNFQVVLHFAETWYGVPGKGKGGVGSRKFHVNAEGSRKLTDFDIFKAAGGAMKAVRQTFQVSVTDGLLNLDFLTGPADLPRVSAIEVMLVSPASRLGASEESAEIGSDHSSIYPNPAARQFTLNIGKRHSRKLSAVLISPEGSRVRIELPENAIPGSKVAIDISGLPVHSGIYLLDLRSEQFAETNRIVFTE